MLKYTTAPLARAEKNCLDRAGLRYAPFADVERVHHGAEPHQTGARSSANDAARTSKVTRPAVGVNAAPSPLAARAL